MLFNDILSGIKQLENPTINLLMVMVLVWTAGVLFRKIKQPPVLGELLAGIIFGPCFLGIIHPDPTLKVLSELGVFFLMFYAGLETNPFDLKRMGKLSFMVGIGGFIIPFALGFFVCYLIFNESMTLSLFMGLGLSITAIAVNARVLNDMYLQSYRVAPVIIGASIIDDVLSFALFTAIIGAGLGAYLGKMNLIESTVVACAMNGRGAVELVIASIGLEMGIIDNVFFSILVVIAFLTTLFPPVSLSFLLNKKGRDDLVPIES